MPITWDMVNPEPIPDPPVSLIDRYPNPYDLLAKIDEHYEAHAMRRLKRFARIKVLVEWLPEWNERDFDRIAERHGEEGAIEVLAQRAALAVRDLEARSKYRHDTLKLIDGDDGPALYGPAGRLPRPS